MNALRVKFIFVFILTIAGYSTAANSLDWGEACPTENINQWLESCKISQSEQACFNHFIGIYSLRLNDDSSSQRPSTQSFIRDVSEHPNTASLISALWETMTGCSDFDQGSNQFNQFMPLLEQSSIDLGTVPAGKAEVKINLNAITDVDLQLYDGSTALLEGAQQTIIDHKGMRITYSGSAGDDFSAGNEFIQISGITSVPLRLMLSGNQSADVMLSNQWGIDKSLGATTIPNREVFDHLAESSVIPGAVGTGEVKFLIKNINTDYPSLYFMHSGNVPLHLDFAYDVLNWYPNLSYNSAYRQFSRSTYFLDSRQNLAGSVLAHDNFIHTDSNKQGLYSLQLWPTDPVSPELIVKAHHLLSDHMQITDNNFVYFPASDIQSNIYTENEAYFAANQVSIIDSETLFNNITFGALNLGEGYGTLRVVREGNPTPSVNDVVIFTYIPNDLSHVAGIITDTPQTPLSHINLIARQNNTPNAYIKDATTHPTITPFLNQLVHYQVTEDGFMIEAATQAAVDAWLEDVRPAETQTPLSDLSTNEPARLDTLRHEDWIRFGAKAANVAELVHVLEPGTYPAGYAIPFAMYDEFMSLKRCEDEDGDYRDLCDNPDDTTGKSLYQQIQTIMAEEDFINSPDIRMDKLKDFRKEVKKSEVPADMSNTLESIRYFWDPDGEFTHSIRLRSSTNNEDLDGFNGAGLYESNTHHPNEGDIADSVKKVWASLWTARAFEERRFYRIDHFKTYMGVLAHLSYGDEQANGVAVTKNIFDSTWEGYYVNTQYGEISITNPEPINTADGVTNSIPDEFLLVRLVSSVTGYTWIQQYLHHSNVEEVYGEPVPTENVLTDEEVIELRVAMQRIQNHFKAVYNGDENFAMDIEFKITRTDDGTRGHLEIKQARPWID